MNAALKSAKRVVIKVGSALLADPDGVVDHQWLVQLASDVAWLRQNRTEVIIVTSGAIAVGSRRLGFAARPVKLEDKQATASVGQIVLAHAWQDALKQAGLETGQLLLTLEDTESRRRYLNARATVETLLKMGVVPVVNENDTIATSEIRFGDNDRLSARVAVMATADLLILLSDVDGLYAKNPKLHADAGHIPEVNAITPQIEAMAGAATSLVGTGGMTSKLTAAKIAMNAGCSVILTMGTIANPIRQLAEGQRHTRFIAQNTARAARKDWIAGSLSPAGTLLIDEGAKAALIRGSSLLPAGVVGAQGRFQRGDAVWVKTAQGETVAKGLIAYDLAGAQAIIGRKSHEIPAILGYEGRQELIHRDDLVLM